jgi:endonuclease/exonuclease/phosphatase family metal-dependent hydrolase
MIETTSPSLVPPDLATRDSYRTLERTEAVPDRTLASLTCLNTVEVGGKAEESQPLAFPFNVVAWNLERCLFAKDSSKKLADRNPGLVLLSEMDKGMARTAQKHPTAEIAGNLGMRYAYGVEFLELGLGSPIELSYCADDFNALGFHGNALLATGPIVRPFLLRLPGRALWFEDAEQPRIGGRVAVGGIVETVEGHFVAVSTHLESVADGGYRGRQMTAIIDAVEAYAPGLPILIGGDLNTGNHSGGDWRTDDLFETCAARGFTCHGGPLDQFSTRRSLISRWADREMKLDWIFTRGLKVSSSHLVSSLDDTGRPLSDHDLIVCRVEGLDDPA